MSDENDRILFCKKEEFIERCASETDPPDSKSVDSILFAVARFMDNFCQRRLASRTYTLERYDPTFENDVVGCYLYLRNPPISSISGIYLDGASTALDSDAYSLHYSKRGKVYRASGWNDASYYIDVTYTGGYSSADTEWDDLRFIHKELAFLTWKRGGKNHLVGYEALNQAVGFLQSISNFDSDFRSIVDDRLSYYRRVH